jgi:hypothetical protein
MSEGSARTLCNQRPQSDCNQKIKRHTSPKLSVESSTRPNRRRQRGREADLPDQLFDELATSYSVALYGAPGRVQIPTLRVVWPSILSAAASASLAGVVHCAISPDRWLSQRTYLFIDAMTNNFLNMQAVWVHQPPLKLLPAPASHSWVEVSHCFYYNYGEHVHARTSMWFFAVPGSGVSINVGRTLHIHAGTFGARSVERMHKFMILVSRNTTRGTARLRKQLRELTNQTDVGYDSLQFPLHAPKSGRWRGERLTEIVMLNWGSEMSFLSSHLDHIRCGRHPYLRPCTLSDAAIRVHGPACARQMPTPWVERLNCSAQAYRTDGGAERKAALEASILRQTLLRKGVNTSLLELPRDPPRSRL